MLNPNLKKALGGRVAKFKSTPDWFKSSFKQQTDFILDPAKLKAGHCTRRAGKSYGVGLYMCKEAYENPGVSIVYVGLTQDSALRIIWKDILQVIIKEFDLQAKFDPYKATVTFSNGAIIYITGADARADDMVKLLGQKFKLAVIDEWSKYRIDVKALIYDVLKSAMADYQGTIVGIGTASNFVKSFAAQVTLGKVKGWSVHKWSALDNPHMVTQFQAEIDELLVNNPNAESEAWFKQNYRGEWIVDTEALIYKYQPFNIITEVPTVKSQYNYILGITLSFRGFTGFSVVAYTEGHPNAFVIETKRHDGMELFHVIEEAQRLNDIYQFSIILCTDASKQLTEAIRLRYPINVQDVDIKDKSGLITLFNSELRSNNIKVLADNADLLEEWSSIIKDDRLAVKNSPKIIEHPLCHNFVADATLFAWQKCYNFYYNPTTQSEDPNDRYWDKKAEEIEQKSEIKRDDFAEFYGKPIIK